MKSADDENLITLRNLITSLDPNRANPSLCKWPAELSYAAQVEDSDDEEDCEDELVAKKIEAAKTIQEKSGHVYLLLKSYVRAGAAYCGTAVKSAKRSTGRKDTNKNAYRYVKVRPGEDQGRRGSVVINKPRLNRHA